MMKKYLFVFLLPLLFVNCSDDIESNTPAIQGELDGILFRATDAEATLNDDGTIVLSGAAANETLTLKTAEFEVGDYQLGESTVNEASFEDLNGDTYLAGEGQISIKKIENNTLYGEFYFDAYKDGVSDTINFNKGSFFGVPLVNAPSVTPDDGDGDDEPTISCADATEAASSAAIAYQTVNPLDAEAFQAACTAYQEALQTQIDACGDPEGSLQEILDGLDCES